MCTFINTKQQIITFLQNYQLEYISKWSCITQGFQISIIEIKNNRIYNK
jgi:hypothetical protein